MSAKLRILFTIGILILLLPYIGIPNSWKNIISIIFGALVIHIVFALKHEYRILKGHINRLEQPTIINDIQNNA